MIRKREETGRRGSRAGRVELPAARAATAGRATLITGPYPPLVQLAALAPLLVLYEIATLFAARPQHEVNVIDAGLRRLFAAIGLTPVYLPGLLILVVLFLIHIYRRDPWRVRADSVGKLWGESLLLTVPLVVLGVLFSLPWGRLLAPLRLADVRLGDLYSTVVYHLGVGLFEEFLFRLVLMSLILLLLERVLEVRRSAAQVVAICLSAALFAAAHHLVIGDEPYSSHAFLMRAACGIYLGIIYMLRGFASAVAVHAAYDVFITVAGVI